MMFYHFSIVTEGVLVGYFETSPSVRVWNPWRGKQVLNVGGADYNESVESGWWMGERRGEKVFERMEPVVFSAELEDRDAPVAGDAAVVNGDGPRAISDGPPPPPPPDLGGIDDDDLSPRLRTGSDDDDDDNEIPPPRVPHVSF